MVSGPGQNFSARAVEGGVELTGYLVGLGDLGDEKREWFVPGASFEVVDTIDGLEVDRVDGEAVKGVGGKGDDVAAVEAGDDVFDERWFWFVGMNAESFWPSNLAPVTLAGPLGAGVAKVVLQSRTLAYRLCGLNNSGARRRGGRRKIC